MSGVRKEADYSVRSHRCDAVNDQTYSFSGADEIVLALSLVSNFLVRVWVNDGDEIVVAILGHSYAIRAKNGEKIYRVRVENITMLANLRLQLIEGLSVGQAGGR